jgi:hypothetical protein
LRISSECCSSWENGDRNIACAMPDLLHHAVSHFLFG